MENIPMHISSPERADDVVVTIAAPEDAEGMQRVVYEAWLAVYPNEEFKITAEDIEERFKSRLSPEGIQARQQQLAHPLDTDTTFVAKEGDAIVGTCFVQRFADHNQLAAIYVSPKCQGKGIGTKLWSAAQSRLDPQLDTFLNVVQYNTKAQAFYRKIGFQEQGKPFEDERFRMKNGAIMPEISMVRRAV